VTEGLVVACGGRESTRHYVWDAPAGAHKASPQGEPGGNGGGSPGAR
jgi:hypothetical protein